MTKDEARVALADFAGREGVSAYQIHHVETPDGGRWIGVTADRKMFSVSWEKSNAEA